MAWVLRPEQRARAIQSARDGDVAMERRTFLKVAAQTAAAAAILPPVLETANAVAAPAQANQTKVTFWQFQTDNNSLAAWRKIISDFNAKNRDVLVEMVIVPWAEQAQK